RFGSSMSATLANAAREIARRVILGIAHDDGLDPQLPRHRAFRDGLHGVVGPLRVDRGPKSAKERLHVRLVECDDPIHAAERGDDLHALVEGNVGALRPLEAARRSVGVESDEEPLAARSGPLQISHVPHVEQVEETVREDESAAERGIPVELRHELASVSHLGAAHAGSGRGTGCARIAASSSARDTVAVPRFITTTEAAYVARSAASTSEAPAPSASAAA